LLEGTRNRWGFIGLVVWVPQPKKTETPTKVEGGSPMAKVGKTPVEKSRPQLGPGHHGLDQRMGKWWDKIYQEKKYSLKRKKEQLHKPFWKKGKKREIWRGKNHYPWSRTRQGGGQPKNLRPVTNESLQKLF